MTKKQDRHNKNPNIQPWGMSGLKRCTRCGAIGKLTLHMCLPPEGYILVDGLWKGE